MEKLDFKEKWVDKDKDERIMLILEIAEKVNEIISVINLMEVKK